MRRTGRTTRRHACALAVVAFLTVVAGSLTSGGAAPAAASPPLGIPTTDAPDRPVRVVPTTARRIDLRSCPDRSNGWCAGVRTVPRHTTVRPLCTMTADRRRWLLIGLDDGTEGFAEAGDLRGAISATDCRTVPRVMAGLAAIDRIGESIARDTDARLFGDWGAVYGEWSGDCKKLASASYRAAGVTLVGGNAKPAFDFYRSTSPWTGTSRTPPYGALVGYDVAMPYGHIAVAVGGERIVTTFGPEGSRTPNQVNTTWIYGNYRGWAVPAG